MSLKPVSRRDFLKGNNMKSIMKKVMLCVGLLLALILAVGGFFFWNIYQKLMTMEAIQYDPQLTIFIGGGSNSIVLTSEDGSKVLIVDTKMSSGAKKLRESVKANDIAIVNTHYHLDHIGGNSLYPSAKIIAGAYSKEQWQADSRYPDMTLEPGEEKVIKVGSETVHIWNIGQAHTMNDVVVYLENRKLLVTGDIVWVNMHPTFLDPNSSATSWIKALDSLDKKYDVKVLVPGHGKVSDKNAIREMRDYFVSIDEAIGDQEELQTLLNKYKDYSTIPIITGFDNTIAFIKKERK